MDENFSWMKIHTEGKKYCLYLYNKSGLVKKLFQANDLEVVQKAMKKRQASKEKIQQALQEALSNPEALQRLANSRK